jgi:hypothetical protein
MQGNTAEKKALTTRRAWLVCASLPVAGLARAGIPWPTTLKRPVGKVAPKKPYLISAVLRESVRDFTFRLMHSVQSAGSEDEAIGILTRAVMEKYPGYAIAQTTVTDIVLAPGACPGRKPSGPRKPNRTLYAVSAVMGRSRNDLDTLLVNGWLPGNSADEALDRVLRDVAAKYPDVIPISTLVNELHPALVGCTATGLPPSPALYHGERV